MTRPPGDFPGEGGYGSSSEHPSAESTDWFSPRAGGNSSASTPGLPGDAPAGEAQPEWFASRNGGGFTGASDPGGRPYAQNSSASQEQPGYLSAPVPADFPAGPAASGSQSAFDRPFPTGPGSAPSASNGGSGSYGSGDYGYGSGGYGARKKRKKSALIGPMAGAVGLAMLLGVAVYAFSASGGGCSGSGITLNLSVAKEIAPGVEKAVDTFNKSKKEVDGSCVTGVVAAADPSAVRTVLTGEGVSTGQTTKPDVWIPDTSLWTGLVQSDDPKALTKTETSIATTPIVVAMPRTLALYLKQKGIIERPSWDNLLKAAGGITGGGVTKNELIDPKLLDMRVANPGNTGAGMASISMVRTLLASDKAADTIFAGIVQTIRNHTSPTVESQFQRFHRDARGRYPLLVTPEQAVAGFNSKKPKEPAVAIYPEEGMVSLDYPVNITTTDKKKKDAAALLQEALVTPDAVKGYQALGFRDAARKAPANFSEEIGLSSKRISPLPVGNIEDIKKVTQDWQKLSLAIRMLAIVDISGTMAKPIEEGKPVTRMQAILQIASKGLPAFPQDSEIGVWSFSTNLKGKQPWREEVPLDRLSKRFGGSVTQQARIGQALLGIKAIPTGNTALYETLYSAYKHMTSTYAPDRINSIVLFTDEFGQDNPGGMTHGQLMAKLKPLIDPKRKVQIIVISIGSNAKVLQALTKITEPTGGAAYVPKTADEIQKIFLQAISKRMCTPPNC